MFFEITRIAKSAKPKIIILENVRNLLSGGKTNGQWMRSVLAELHNIGYNCDWEVISAADVGALHLRERVWFVCVRKDIKVKAKGQGIIFDSKIKHTIGDYGDGDWHSDGDQLEFIDFGDGDEDRPLVSDFPKSGTMYNGILYSRFSLIDNQHATSQRLPTPQASDGSRGATSLSRNEKRLGGISLVSAAKHGVGTDNKIFCPTQESIEKYPTPRANDAQHSKYGQPSFDYRKNKRYMAECVMETVPVGDRSGSLNPDWVEFLMGYDLDWTNIKKERSEVKSDLRNEWENIPRLTLDNENRRVRLKALGNSIVPQIAEFIISKITESGIL